MASSVEKLYQERFKELKPALRPEDARVEAERCLYCYDAPCVTACPTHIDIPKFIKQIASGNLTGSAKTILDANALGHSCARACPVEVLCEGACVFHDWQEKPIDIARLQRRATDALEGKQPFKLAPDNGFRVAVVGAGPAGLACASYLRRLGFGVTLFDRDRTPGGLNTFGIAEYKMTARVSLDEVERILQMGIETKFGVEVKSSAALEAFDAVFVGIGLGETNALRVPGEGLPGVFDALRFIRQVKTRAAIAKSECTVVIGAGNTAIDAVTQSKRAGAAKVIMAYRRGEKDMKAYGFEYDLAKGDGAEFLWNAQPTKIVGAKKVEGVEFMRTDGTGGLFTVACDRVIKAIGQTKQLSLAKSLGLVLREDGRIMVDEVTLRTSDPRVFAGGDAINGGKEVVNAAADGKRAAYAIFKSLLPKAAVPPGNEGWIRTIEGSRLSPVRNPVHA